MYIVVYIIVLLHDYVLFVFLCVCVQLQYCSHYSNYYKHHYNCLSVHLIEKCF